METMHEENKINDLISETLLKLKSLSDSGTIVGDPIVTPEGVTIIPVCKASVGFVLGGGEYPSTKGKHKSPINYPMAGGSGGGVNLVPVGFLVESGKEVSFISCERVSDGFNKAMLILNKTLDALKTKGEKNEK
ncbi:MAG: spore germination protein GerW family protein [Clostridia bacterium]